MYLHAQYRVTLLLRHLQDHTLCRYNVGNLAKLVYDLLADYLIKIKGYDRAIKNRNFEDDIHLLAKGKNREFRNWLKGRIGFCTLKAVFHPKG